MRPRFVVPLLLVCAIAAACGDGGSGTSAPQGSAAEPFVELAVDRPAPESPDVDALVSGINAVGYDLFAYAASQSDGDVVLSPASIGIAFGMADAGATGTTAAALEELFAYPAEGEERWAAFNAVEQQVTDVGEPVVRLANREFPDLGFAAVDGYDETLARLFGAAIEPLPLQADPDGSTARINDWVSEQTEGLIPELLPPGFVNPASVMVLVNALYLEADWARPFGKYPTEDQPFTRLDGSTVTVPLMHELELDGPSAEGDGYAATEVPYEGSELSMLVIVPDEGRYADVEGQLAGGLVDEIDERAESGPVELWLPRFESDTNFDLRDAIESGLGVDDVFGVAGFEGIAPGITLESAVHAADIAVDEIGTVAAAATALGFEVSGPPAPDVVVRADKPFVYVIRHIPTGTVLFVGRVLDPAA